MVSIPADMPRTVVPDILALSLAALHTPPAGLSDKVMVAPTHTIERPAITPGAGKGFTVTGCVATAVPQLLVTLYEIVARPPDTPLTKPVADTVAMPGSVANPNA